MADETTDFQSAAAELFRRYSAENYAASFNDRAPATLEELIAEALQRFYRQGLIEGLEGATVAVEDSAALMRKAVEELRKKLEVAG